MGLVKTRRVEPLDNLSDWVVVPSSAGADAAPVRAFDTALAFLAQQEAEAAS